MDGGGEFLAVFLSAVVGLALEPLIIGVGVVIGLGASSWLQRIFVSFLFALILTFAVLPTANVDPALSTWLLVAGRTIATAIWSAVGALGRWLIARYQAV
jgi:hypothetical protein